MAEDLALAAAGRNGTPNAMLQPKTQPESWAGKWLARIVVVASGLSTIAFWIAVYLTLQRWLG